MEQTLAENEDDLKERTLGVEVFHRPPDYDTNADPVVRLCAAEVRKRLEGVKKLANVHIQLLLRMLSIYTVES